DGDADEEAVLAEEPAPGLVEEGAVGLQGVADPLIGSAVALLEGEGLLEERSAGEGGLAALPGDGDIVAGVGEEAREEGLEGGERHASRGPEELAGAEVVAVPAAEVAGRPDGLDHQHHAAG